MSIIEYSIFKTQIHILPVANEYTVDGIDIRHKDMEQVK